MMMDFWVDREFAPWEGFELPVGSLQAELARIASEHIGVFYFTIQNNIVSFDGKSKYNFIETGGRHAEALLFRAELYRQFLQDVILLFGITGKCNFAIDIDDLSSEIFEAPVFRFQKVRGKREILLPDIDFLQRDFYVNEQDEVAYNIKQHQAIFVGSTTGDPYITRSHVENLTNRRLRSATYFRGSESVKFHLPNIVQCDTPETEQLIEALNVGGKLIPWEEQLRSRYLLSADGNGATCSRVVLSLLSNSVLMKYHSEHQLYYFDGLVPWRDYIPIYEDQDVEVHISRSLNNLVAHGAIAARSRDFARRHLSRIEVMRYTAKLIQRYMSLTGQEVANLSPHHVDCSVHVSDVGTIWAGGNAWAGRPTVGWIEGFSLYPGALIDPGDLEYQFVMEDGRLSSPCTSYEYCGTRGEHRPIYGVRICLSGHAGQTFKLAVSCRFEGEAGIHYGGDGDVVHSVGALRALKVTIVPVADRQGGGDFAG